MFQSVPLPIIRSLFTVHSTIVYVTQVCRQLSSSAMMAIPLPVIRSLFYVHSSMVYVIQDGVPSWSFSKAVYKPVWYTCIPLLIVQWMNSWWWAEEVPETCRVSWQNKFVKLVRPFGFIMRKLVTMHGHVDVNLVNHKTYARQPYKTNLTSNPKADGQYLYNLALTPYFPSDCTQRVSVSSSWKWDR